MSEGININIRDKSGDRAIQCTANRGHAEIVKLLIESGADVHARGVYGETVLDAAMESCNTEIIRLLLEHGFDVQGPVWENVTPLHVAAGMFHNSELVELLLSRGADLNALSDGETPLDWAMRIYDRNIVRLLKKKGGVFGQ